MAPLFEEKIADSYREAEVLSDDRNEGRYFEKGIRPSNVPRLRDSLSSGSVETCVVGTAVATTECC